jgi:hypothetical protein
VQEMMNTHTVATIADEELHFSRLLSALVLYYKQNEYPKELILVINLFGNVLLVSGGH